MLDPGLYLGFLKPLHLAGIDYVVTGSVASILYGEPRTTNDVDILLRLVLRDASLLGKVFPEDKFYAPPLEVMVTELHRETNGHFNLIHLETGFKADVYLEGNSDLHRWAIANARKVEVNRVPVSVAPPEYVILRKLQYFEEGGSTKHLRDIEAMLRVSRPQIDITTLEELVHRYGLMHHWNSVKDS